MSSILVVGDERPTGQIAGPAIRVASIVRQLGQFHDVTVMTPNGNSLIEGSSRAIPLVPEALTREIKQHQITISRPGLLGFRNLRLFQEPNRFLIVDLVIPQPVEGLHYFAQFKDDGLKLYSTAQRRLRRTLLVGDFFLAASEQQRVFWLGAALSTRSLPPTCIQEDPNLEALVALAPSGVDSAEGLSPEGEKGRLLWGGGLWDWTDPKTLVEAVASLERDDLLVHFPGTRHPDGRVPLAKNVAAIESMARELPVKVELQQGWSSKDERLDYLQRAFIGVSLHGAGIEPALSWRFRVLDYLWAGLPIIITAGCPFAALVQEYGAGVVVPPGDVKACASAIEKMVDDEDFLKECRQGVEKLRQHLDWQKTLKPLLHFCQEPHKAPDHGSESWYGLVRMALA